MKTRLIIASSLAFSIAVVLAIVMRVSAVAQEDPQDPAKEEQVEDAPAEDPDADYGADAREDPDADDSALLETPVADVGREPDAGEISVFGDEEVVEAAHAHDATEAEEIGSFEPDTLVFDIHDFGAVDVEAVAAQRDEQAETLTVDFPDEEIRSILRIVADLFDLNLVIPEALAGRASIKLRDVTWQQVFDVILSPVGFTYVEDNNIIKVVSLETLTLEPPVTRVVILNYAQADEIRPTIDPLVDTTRGGRLQIDRRSNALVITERPTRMRRIESIIEDLDKPNVQVMIESKFIETRNRHLENIGVNWASLEGWGLRAGPFQHGYERDRGSERDSGREHTTQSSSGTRETSRNFMGSGGNGFEMGQESFSESGGSSGTWDSRNSFNDTTRTTMAVFSADQFDVILSALRTTNDVKLVSNPTVVTLNNRPAEIHIGEEFPIVLPRFNPQTGTYEAGEYSTIDIGIKLDVTPQVNNAGFINLAVSPDVSTLSSTIRYFGADYPVRSTRRARSEVTIKDGFTVAIGGLVQEDTVSSESRVPVLGSIPVLGRVFRSNNNDTDSRNLIIFLTARTLNPDGSTVEETTDPRMIRSMGLRRNEVPGYRPDMPHWPEEEKAVDVAVYEETAVVADQELNIVPMPEASVEVEELQVEVETEPEAATESVETDEDLVSDAQKEDVSDEMAADSPEGEPDEIESNGQLSDEKTENGTERENGDSEDPVAVDEAVENGPSVEEPEPPAVEPTLDARRARGWLTPVR